MKTDRHFERFRGRLLITDPLEHNAPIWIRNYGMRFMGTSNYESMADREKKWGAFSSDPEWHAKRAETEKNGPLVMTFSNQFLKPTSFSSVK